MMFRRLASQCLGSIPRAKSCPLVRGAQARQITTVLRLSSKSTVAALPVCRSQASKRSLRLCASTVRSIAPSIRHLPEVAPAAQYDMLVPEIFRQAARKHADQIALEGPSSQMTYAELDTVTDSLAAFLRTNYRVVPETVVGIYMERCEEYVVAVLAIWKAGAAYCPIELAYPGPLLKSVFEEVEPRVVLTKERYTENMPLSTSRFLMDGDWRSSVQRTAPNPLVLSQHMANPENLGYVIYSGGSTGRPKGIEAPHRSPTASYLWRLSISGYGPGARVGCNVFFVWEALRPLLRGGTTVVIPDDVIFDMGLLAPCLQDKALTEMLFTPSLFETMLDTVDPDILKKLPLEVIWLNGEVVTTKLLEKATNLLPHVRLFNTYSISECGEVCAGPLDFREDCPNFSPVGKVAGFAKHLLVDTGDGGLNSEIELVPKGSPGELWISGRGVGRGYTKNPVKTAEAFVTHDGVPFYRTGDLARELHDGVLEILGRCDFMVKVRGYSVVLGSVESAIDKLIGVHQSCVVARGEEGTDKRLVAYLVACPTDMNRGRLPLDPNGIDEFGRSPALFQELLKELPHYAVPSVYVVIDSIPIHQVSGKTNRAGLPPPPVTPPAAVVPTDLKFDGSTQAVQLVFEEVLSIPAGTLTEESNFFEFGGHSLLATKLLSRVAALGGPQSSVADFVKNPTVLGFASSLRGESAPPEQARLLPKEVEKHVQNMSDININMQAFWRYIVFTNSSARVLLTGATGYVGANLVAQLLRATQAQVFCIARAPQDGNPENANKDARERVLANLEAQGHVGLDLNRLEVIAGDVSQRFMGLSEDEYLFLQHLIDVVVHAAAGVNLAYGYSLLEGANVLGTARAIDFARGGKVKALHYISTNGIFPETGDLKKFSERDVPPHHLLKTGYGQTKWVAEQLVAEARRLGLPTVIYRLGNVAGPLEGKGWNPSDSNLLFLRACLERGSVPDGHDWEIELTPVDFIAEFVVNCVMDLKFANGQTFHMINGSKLPLQHVEEVAKRAGFPAFRANVASWCQAGSSAEGLLSVVLGEEALQSLLGRHHICEQDNTKAACAHFGMTYPKLNKDIFDGYLARLIDQGLLPNPQPAGKLTGRLALVTGATSGIGEAVAVALAGEGATVALIARNADKLEKLSKKLNGTIPLSCDVTSREAVQAMVSEVTQKYNNVDILVNCAGTMYFTLMKNGHFDEWETMIDVNVKGVVNMCGAALPSMMQARCGHVVNISSDAARTVFPALTVYNASKAFVTQFSKGLRAECVGTGLRVTDIQPGDTATNLIMNNTDLEAATKVGVNIGKTVGEGSGRSAVLSPEDIASAVVYAVTAPEHVGVHEVLIEPRDQMFGDPTALDATQ